MAMKCRIIAKNLASRMRWQWAGMLDAVDDEGLLLTSRRAVEPFLARPANLPLAGAWPTRDVCKEVDAGI